MQKVTKQHGSTGASSGWMVKADRRYYTGNRRSPLETWSPFQKFAKVYKHKGWAQTMAARIGGQAIYVEKRTSVTDHDPIK